MKLALALSLASVATGQRRWQAINTYSGFETISDFQMLGPVGYASGWVIGRQGPNSQRTDDNGRSWNLMPIVGDVLPRVALTCVAGASETSAITLGPGFAFFASFLHSTDGRNFQVYSNFNEIPFVNFMSLVRPVRGLRDTYVAIGSMEILGDFSRPEPYAVTENGGVDWTISRVDRSVFASYQIAYGAFPSPSTWYLSGNDGSAEDARANNHTQFIERWGLPLAERRELRKQQKPVTMNTIGGIYKTTDAGASWARVYTGQGISAQKMSCTSNNECWAIAKGTEDHPTCDTACILYTDDGGVRWTIQHVDRDEWFDFYDIAFVNQREGFATGGSLLNEEEQGKFYRTSDGGRTWTFDLLDGVYPGILSIDNNGIPYSLGTATTVTGPVIFSYQ